MDDPILAARRAFADELKFTTHMRSSPLHAAFARVPREAFVGPGPWRIKSGWDLAHYWTTEDSDPGHVYHDVLIALDESLGLNNGQPSLWAFLFDRMGVSPNESVIHLGCGTGYYSAVLAELVGPGGHVSALDIHPEMIARARDALAPWPQVDVRHADGASTAFGPADVIVASAGATHPLPAWLDALKPCGRLLFPMTVADGPGAMILITRQSESCAARFLCPAAFYEFSGARDAAIEARLAAAFASDRGRGLRSLRRDRHRKDKTCWLHGDGWCLSRREPQG